MKFVGQLLAQHLQRYPRLALVALVGALAGLLPAVLAYRTEVAENLAPLS